MKRLALALLLLAAARGAGAQTSPFVPLEDPAYAYIAALQARGALRGLPLLERPLTVTAIRRALAAENEQGATPVMQGWMRRLSHAIARYAVPTTGDSAAGFGYQVSAGLRATAQTSGRRELMLADSTTGIFPGATLRGVVSAGRVTAAARLVADNSLRDDPDFAGKKDRWVRGRMEDAYVSAQWPLGELFFGRITRNWGPAPLEGAHLGSAPYSYDHVFARLGVQRLHLATLLARLDDTPSLTAADAASATRRPTGPPSQRNLAIHRLAITLGGLEIAASESYLYSGVGRGLSFRLANPLNLYNLAQYNENEAGNAAYSLDAAWRTPGPWFGGQLFVDDVQVDRCAVACQEPSSYAASLLMEGLPLGSQRLFASYTRVTNLVYRTPDPTERYASFGVGLGRASTDYDEARLGLDAALFLAAPLRLYMAARRQGEGDYRLPFPRPSEYPTTRQLLEGRVLRTVRLAASGAMFAGGLSLNWDAGLNRWSRNGRAGSGFEGRVTLRWEPDWAVIRGATH